MEKRLYKLGDSNSMTEPLLKADELTIQYETTEGMLTAVSDATFIIEEGEIFGLVGESGCGKSTIAKSVIGALDQNGSITSGSISYRGTELQNKSEQELNEEIRWSEISYIPQSSMNSLDPLERVSEQAMEIARTHTDISRDEAMERFGELFEVVGLPSNRITDYPHQFSGGMQQRAIIALALFLEPSLVIADEPTTALDVIMQDQIFKYLDEIPAEGLSVMLITHDISVIFESCDRLAIMHGGQIAESGTTENLYDSPRHPYSILLQDAFPDIRYPNRELTTIDGNPPQLFGEVNHCSFVDRCPWAVDECCERAPPLESVEHENTSLVSDDENSTIHQAACFRMDEVHQLHEETEQMEERL